MKKFFFLLFIIFLPTQFGIHFWPDWALVNGVRVDYFSPTLYFTDTLIIAILFLELWLKFKSGFRFKLSHFSFIIYCFVVLLALLNICSSLSPAVTIYKWIKVLEFGMLGYFIVKNFQFSIFNFQFLLTPVLYESVLAIWQFLNQSSIGRLWYFLGERTFNSTTLGIANTVFNGQLLMRPYGTFPHPNVLGGFLAVVLPIILARFLHNSRKINAGTNEKFYIRLFVICTIVLGYVSLFLSLSRTAILVGVLASLIVVFPHLKRVKMIGVMGGVGLIGGILLLWPRISSLKLETEPIVVREQLNGLAFRNWLHSPVLGTGLGTAPLYNSYQLPINNNQSRIKNFALQFQPTHNVYMLILAETGIVGLGIVVIVVSIAIIRQYRQKNWILLTSLLSIGVLGLFDHYFLTLQQGQLILVIVLGLCLSSSHWESRV